MIVDREQIRRGAHTVRVVELHDKPKVWTERAECSCGWTGPSRRRHTEQASLDASGHRIANG